MPDHTSGPHRLSVADGRMVLTFDRPLRAVASTVLGGGVGEVRTWLNLQVPSAYARTDPVDHLREEAAGLPGPVAATMTAAEVAQWVQARVGGAWVVATVGLSVPLAAAGALHPTWAPGTINVAAVLEQSLGDAGLVNAVQTVSEAKAQALAEAGVAAVNHVGPATGTATDSVLIACTAPSGGGASPVAPRSDFAGTATTIGHDLAHAAHAAITAGARRWAAS